VRTGWGWHGAGVLRSNRAVDEAFGRGVGALRRLTAQQMAAGDEQIGQRAGHQQATGVLVEGAIAQLDKAEDSLDDGDRMLDPGPHFRVGSVFRPLDQVDHVAMAIAAIGELPGLGRVLPDHRALAAIVPLAPHPSPPDMQQLGSTRLSATLAAVAAST
jgi:hypothetical protein